MDNLIKSFKSLKWYEWIMIAIMIVIAGWSMIKAFIYPSSNSLPAWLTVINFISAICGIICIFFCAKASISNYAFGIVNTIVYVIYLAYRHIYGTLCLEVFIYLPVKAGHFRQFFVRALLDQISVVHHNDVIGMHQR